jgi:transcriptional regulator of acetoin/glycerol metabolism
MRVVVARLGMGRATIHRRMAQYGITARRLRS